MKGSRRLLMVIALVSMIAPARPAMAAPVAGLVGMISSWVGGVMAAGGIGAFALQLGVSLALSVVSQALLRPSTPNMKPSDRMVNTAQPVTYQTRLYGRARVGGAMGLNVQRDGYRHRAILIAAHSTRGPHIHYLDNWEVELLEEGNPDNPPISGGLIPGIPGETPPWGSVITIPMAGYDGEDDLPVPTFRESWACIRPYTGQPGQAADQILIDAITEWTVAHDMAGISYAAIWAKKVKADAFARMYPNGDMWEYAPVWDGHDQIYDPRDDSYGWTRNAALIAAHELTVYQGHTVDWEDVAAEADVCDQIVINGDGGAQPRWQVDMLISDDQEFTAILSGMMTACDGFLFERPDGSTGFRVGRWIEPTVTLTSRDFLVLEIVDGAPFGAPNEFAMQYSEPAADWKESPTGVWVHDPEGNHLRDEIAVYACGTHNQASRLNKRRARKTHARYRGNGTVQLVGYDLIGERFVNLVHPELGIEIYIEMEKLTRGELANTFDVEFFSTAGPADFAFDAAAEEPARPIYERLEGDNIIQPPDGLTATVVTTGTGAASILWEWPEQEAWARQQLRYRASDAGLPDWITIEIPSGDASGTPNVQMLTTGMIDGATYEAQLRNLDNQAGYSSWTPAVPLSVVAVANTVAPPALVSFGVTAEAGQAVVAFEAPNDGVYYATRIYRADDSTSFADAVLVRTEYGIPSNSDSWTDTGLAAGNYSYWGRPINSSGIAGPLSARADVTIL